MYPGPDSGTGNMPDAFRRVAVLGAGAMGSGIAHACAQAGVQVSVRDLKDELVQAGIRRVRDHLAKRVEKGKLSEEGMDAVLGRIRGTTRVAEAVRDADLVIEAVFEDPKVKREVLQEAERSAGPSCVLATNTSSLSVSELGRATKGPERFAGLHFFNPAAVNLLVEVIPGEKTAPAVVQALLRFSRQLGKVPILVQDSPGFAVNRFFVPLLNEACRLREDGLEIPAIESGAKEAFGTTMGFFELMNFTGIPIAHHAQESLHRGLGEFYKTSSLLKKQFESGAPWELSGTADPSATARARERLLGVAFAIASSIVEEGVAAAADVDKGAALGLRWKRGPFAMMNELGVKEALRLAEEASQQHKGRLPVPRVLRQQAERAQPWSLSRIRYEAAEGIAVVTIDRPETMNALDRDVLRGLIDAIDRARDDASVNVVVLTGEGPSFVSGADIAVMAGVTPLQSRDYTKLGQRAFRKIERLEKPVIAAVNGYALGGGLELVLACDLAIASEKAVFGLPEVTLGIHPGFGGTQRLPRLIGPRRAKELILTGESFDARRASELGVVNRVVPHASLLDETLALAKKIAANAPVAVRLAKSAINRGLETDLDTALGLELESASVTFGTEDRVEGMRAFLEKRKPEWKGK